MDDYACMYNPFWYHIVPFWSRSLCMTYMQILQRLEYLWTVTCNGDIHYANNELVTLLNEWSTSGYRCTSIKDII